MVRTSHIDTDLPDMAYTGTAGCSQKAACRGTQVKVEGVLPRTTAVFSWTVFFCSYLLPTRSCRCVRAATLLRTVRKLARTLNTKKSNSPFVDDCIYIYIYYNTLYIILYIEGNTLKHWPVRMESRSCLLHVCKIKTRHKDKDEKKKKLNILPCKSKDVQKHSKKLLVIIQSLLSVLCYCLCEDLFWVWRREGDRQAEESCTFLFPQLRVKTKHWL